MDEGEKIFIIGAYLGDNWSLYIWEGAVGTHKTQIGFSFSQRGTLRAIKFVGVEGIMPLAALGFWSSPPFPCLADRRSSLGADLRALPSALGLFLSLFCCQPVVVARQQVIKLGEKDWG